MSNPESTGSDPITDEDVSVFNVESDAELTWQDRYKRLFRTWILEPAYVIKGDPRGLIGLGIVSLFVLMGTVGVLLIPEPTPDGPIFRQPYETLKYPLGTQTRGKGLLRLIVHSTPNMLKMIAAGGIFATVTGSLVGVISGYKGGMIDTILSAVADIALAIPALPLVIALSFVIQPEDPYVVGLLVVVNAWGGLARSVRAEVLPLRNENFVEKSRTLGLSESTIFLKDILPGILPYIFVGFVQQARLVIFNSVALYFLGILPFTTLNWGVTINRAFGGGALFSPRMFHWLYVPMITVILISLGFMLLAQSLDRVFNPRTRTREAGETTSLNQ